MSTILDGRPRCAIVSISNLSSPSRWASLCFLELHTSYRIHFWEYVPLWYSIPPEFLMAPNQSQMQRPKASDFNWQHPNFSQFRQNANQGALPHRFQIKVSLSLISLFHLTIISLFSKISLPNLSTNFRISQSVYFSCESSHFASSTTSVFPSNE